MSIVVINAITVPPERAPELEARFAARAGAVDDQPGFEGFQLLRPTDGRDVYYVVTQWDSQDSFQKWTESQAFGHGHRQTSEQGPVSTAAEVLQFDVVDFDAG